MIAYQVNDMTCGLCASQITQALKWVDPAARVAVDLAAKRVEVSSSQAAERELKEAIEDVGYTPGEAMRAFASGVPATASGCCGCR